MAIRGSKQPTPGRLKTKFPAIPKAPGKNRSNDGVSRFSPDPQHLDVVDKNSSLFEPDVLSRAQYFDAYRRKSLEEPEKKLMLAVLEDAIHCFKDNVLAENGAGRKLFVDAQVWFSQEDEGWIFSFRNVSELLGINPEYLRAGLTRCRDRQLARQLSRRVLKEIKMAS
jgi:hypothetical protein